ncbi:hypothetical protein HOD08_04610 [bacterium]|nr:hypothetical protein [bacterium]
MLPAISVSGSNNVLEGAPCFDSGASITLVNSSSELELALTNKLDQTITINGGTLTLKNDLSLDDSAVLSGSGTIDVNGKTLSLHGKETDWATTLTLTNAGDIELHAKTNLTGTWFFGPTEAGSESRAMINGNGNILELGTAGIIRVDQEVGLGLVDIAIKGIGDYANKGRFILHDVNSTLSLSNTTIVLDGSVSLTQGKMLVHGGDCSIITGSHKLEFSDTMCLTIDGVTLWYDPLSTPDIQNIRRGADVAYSDDGINIDYQNNGSIRVTSAGAGADIIYDDATNSLLNNEVIGSGRIMNFRGNNSATLALDGKGYAIEMGRGTDANDCMTIAVGKTVTLSNVVLRNFNTDGVSLGDATSYLKFGSKVTIELGSDETIDTFKWWFNGTGVANSPKIYGKGFTLTLSKSNSLHIENDVVLSLQDVRIAGLTDIKNINFIGDGSKIIARDTQFVLDGNYSFTKGSIDVYDSVSIEGIDHQFGMMTSGTLAIKTDSTLLLDRSVTFTYAAIPILSAPSGSKDGKLQLTMADATARLHLNGCNFYTSWTCPTLQTGRMIIEDKVTLSSSGRKVYEGIKLDDELTIEVLASAVLDMSGYVTYA